MKDYLTKHADYNTTRISNISDASKKILELYFTHLPQTQNLIERPKLARFAVSPHSSPPITDKVLSDLHPQQSRSPARPQFQVVSRTKPSEAVPPRRSTSPNLQQNDRGVFGNNIPPRHSLQVSTRSQAGNFSSASSSRSSPALVLPSTQQEEKRIHFPNGQDLVTAAIQFSDAIKAQDHNSEILFLGPGHLPSLLWAKAVETSLESQNNQRAIMSISDALRERMSFSYEHYGKALPEGITHVSVHSNSPKTKDVVESLLIAVDFKERSGSLTRKLFFPLRISDDSETRVQFIVTYRPMERLSIPTTNLKIKSVDFSTLSSAQKIHDLPTINPAQIMLFSIHSMMRGTIGSNISLTPACHPLILLSRIFEKVEPDLLQGSLSALSPENFKSDLLVGGTRAEELEDMKNYLEECSDYGKRHKISLLATATRFILDHYLPDLPPVEENVELRKGLPIRTTPHSIFRWNPY
ncbi:hypothetical protein JCM3765_006434 [Sporobolomyces pararoseus]